MEVKISGFGGQGIVLAGIIMARAAGLHDKKYVTQTQSYGPEARGGACASEIVISDEKVDYPLVEEADVLIAMSQEALNRYLSTLKEGGTLLVDPDLVTEVPKVSHSKVYKIAATRVATNELGRKIVANMVMLGSLVGISGLTTNKAIKEAVRESVPPGTEGLNLKALEKGMELAREVTREII
jgi:2-oxoglutarate ferredoxin oxidoreductase subunit gamma